MAFSVQLLEDSYWLVEEWMTGYDNARGKFKITSCCSITMFNAEEGVKHESKKL